MSKSNQKFQVDNFNVSSTETIRLRTRNEVDIISTNENVNIEATIGDVRINAKDGKICLHAEKEINIHSKCDEVNIIAKDDVNIKSKNSDVKIEACEENICINAEKDININSKCQNINISSKEDVNLKSLCKDITIEARRGDICVQAEKQININSRYEDVNIRGKHNVNLKSAEKDVNIKAYEENIYIEAEKDIYIKSKDDVFVKSTKKDVYIEAEEKINIKAEKNINLFPGYGTCHTCTNDSDDECCSDECCSNYDHKVDVHGKLDAKAIYQQCNLLIPPATVVSYCGTSAPGGWLLCDGALYSKCRYHCLFEIIGYTFGGGSDTFNVPDLRTRVPIAPGTTVNQTFTYGSSGGEDKHVLSVGEMPSHNHSFRLYDAGVTNTGYAGGSLATTGSDDASTNYTGSDLAHNNMPPYLVLNYIVKF